jgi:DNA-binding beta-propeller fold protein YncE
MTDRNILFLALSLVLMSSCKKDGPTDPGGNIVITPGDNGVYIANEGNFQFGNASVSYFADGMTEAVEDLFQPANNRPLGDVCQSICFFKNRAYVVVNNSGKVEVVNPTTFVSSATVSGFNSPRYVLPVSNSKAYVSDLYANRISIVSLSSLTITGTIPLPGWTEEMALVYGDVFVTNRKNNKLYVISSQSDAVTDSITIGFGANSIVEDKNGKLWVLCSGSPGNNINATLHCINPLTHTVEKTFTFSNGSDAPWRLDINGSSDTLYYLNKDCYRMSINDNALPASPFIPANGRNFYGIGINPNNGNIYLADAIDYVQRGKIYIYRPDGNLTTSFLAGIIPGDFYFKD